MAPLRPRGRQDYEIAIICALTEEADAVLDTHDGKLPNPGQAPGDDNSYTACVLGEHNVVLVHMARMGNVTSAAVAGGLRNSFPNIKLALIVGICGGVPQGKDQPDIFLGDLIISTIVVPYDLGRLHPTGLERKNTLEDNLGRPSLKVGGVLKRLEGRHAIRDLKDDMATTLQKVFEVMPGARNPGAVRDRLYRADYLHKHRSCSVVCDDCAREELCVAAQLLDCDEAGCGLQDVIRSRVPLEQSASDAPITELPPAIHFGRIGSGNAVIRSGVDRDKIAGKDGLIAFEMEGAGMWDQLPCIIIKSVSDYADSHKEQNWRLYAAAVAAAGAKAFLNQWSPGERMADVVYTPATSRTSTFSDTVSPQSSVIFNNHGHVGSQVGTQTIHGDVHHTFRF